MHMTGKLPELNGGDGLGVVIDNIGNNKIDYYLTGEVSYTVETDGPSGTATGDADRHAAQRRPARRDRAGDRVRQHRRAHHRAPTRCSCTCTRRCR